MLKLNRREFLWLAGTVGLSTACASDLHLLNGSRLRAGVIGWGHESEVTIRTLLGMNQFEVTAFSNTPQDAVRELYRFQGKSALETPPFYENSVTMLLEKSPDVLIVSPEFGNISVMRSHMVMHGAGIMGACDGGAYRRQCIQFLPQYEFVGTKNMAPGRPSLRLSGWTRAQIRHTTLRPAEEIETREQLARWIWREIGEAVDFAREILDVAGFNRITARAGYGAPAGTVVFGFVFQEIRERVPRSLEIALHVRPEGVACVKKTELALMRETGSVTFRVAPRSERLTRALLSNMIEAVQDRAPSKLLYSPNALKAGRQLLDSAVERLNSVQ